MARKSITVTLPDTLIANIDLAAGMEGLNRSQYLEKLIATGRDESKAEPNFVKSTEVRGSAGECYEFVGKFFTKENDQLSFDEKREMIIRMYVRPTPEELEMFKGMRTGFAVTLEGATDKAKI